MSPAEMASDLNSLLLLDRLVSEGWFDSATAESVLQLGESESIGAINRLHEATLDEHPVIQLVKGIPDDQGGGWCLSKNAHASLSE